MEEVRKFISKIELATFVNGKPSYKIIPINANDKLSTGGKELRMIVTNAELKALHLIPTSPNDNENEASSYEAAASLNFNDSNVFDAGISANGKTNKVSVRGIGNWTNEAVKDSQGRILPSWSAKANLSTFQTAGADYIEVKVLGKAARGLIENQSDVFYISSHGHHINARIDGFEASSVHWGKDLDVVIISGCSVLDIKGYRAMSFLRTTWLIWLSAGGAWSPGAKWENTGPKYLLGYNWKAPADDKGGVLVVKDYLKFRKQGVGIIEAWKKANDHDRYGRNACAIDTSKNPHEYWYWDEQSGSPVWTKVIKGGSSW